MKIGEKKETSLSPIILTTFFAMFCFKLPIHYRPNKFTIFRFIIDAYFLTKKSQKLKKKTRIYCCTFANFQKEIHFFLGWGHFHQIWWGGNLPNRKKNIKFLENDIGFKKQIGWNCRKDKNLNQRRAIQGSMEKPKAYFNSIHFFSTTKRLSYFLFLNWFCHPG